VGAWQESSMACVNWGDLARIGHGRRVAWARDGMCELGRLGKDWARPESGMGTGWHV